MLDESTPTGFAHFDWLCSAFVSTGFTLMSSIRVARPDIMQATSSGPGRDTRREKRALAVPRLLGCSAGVSGLFATAVFDPTQWSLCVCVFVHVFGPVSQLKGLHAGFSKTRGALFHLADGCPDCPAQRNPPVGVFGGSLLRCWRCLKCDSAEPLRDDPIRRTTNALN